MYITISVNDHLIKIMKRIFYDEILHLNYRNVLSAQDAKVPVFHRISIDHIWAVCVLSSSFFSFIFDLMNFFLVLFCLVAFLFQYLPSATTHQRGAWLLPLCFACNQTVKLHSFMEIQMCC